MASWQSAPLVDEEETLTGWRAAPLADEEEPTKYYPDPLTTLSNIPGSAGNLISSMYGMISDPVGTGRAIGEAGISGIAEQIGQRHGSWSRSMQTAEDDPLGWLADVSTPITGGAGVARGAATLARGVGTASKAAKLGLVPGKTVKPGTGTKVVSALDTAAKYTDPFELAVRGTGAVGKTGGRLTKGLLGATTTAGGEAIGEAASAGFQGGKAAKAYLDNERSRISGEEVVGHAREAFNKVIQNKSLDWTDGMRPIMADTRVLSFAPVRTAIDKAKDMAIHTTHLGNKAVAQPETMKIINEMEEIVNTWEGRTPDFHTMIGFHDMKRQLGQYVANFDKGSVQRSAADQIYGSVKESIANMDSRYTEVIRSYDKASDLVYQLEKTLRLGEGVTTDSALRALQSVLRDTAHTNYGVRRQLVQVLVENGAEHLMKELAGQALRPAIRPGLIAQAGAVGGVGAMFAGMVNPSFLAGMALISPKLMGETAYLAGKSARLVKPMIAADRAMRRHFGTSIGGVVKGPNLMANAATRLSAAQEQSDGFKQALKAQAKKLGYNINDRVLDTIADQILSGDLDVYMRGMEGLEKNKRLMQIITTMGEKIEGEQR